MITQRRLKELLSYDPLTGIFTWLVFRGRMAKPGTRAGALHAEGYVRICIDGKTYAAHRLAFLYMTGKWPKNQGEHINRKRDDNRWENLRDATKSQNLTNTAKAGGFGRKHPLPRGVTKCRHRFAAQLSVDGRSRHIGVYATPEAAHEAWKLAVITSRGDFLPAGVSLLPGADSQGNVECLGFVD